jgi:hypothetical protein
MKAVPIEIEWNSSLPIFASEPFLQAVSDDYGWLAGIDESGKQRCLLPYTIIRKSIFRLVRFRVEAIPVGQGFTVNEEKAFLSSVVEHFRSTGADIIIPATTNTIFRAYPDGADAAPYGSYIIDLCHPEDVLWRNIGRITRQNIGTAKKAGVTLHEGFEHLDEAYTLIRDTFRRSKLSFMSYDALKRFVLGLGSNGKLMVATHEGVMQSCVIYAFSDWCAYAVYAGNAPRQQQGANKLVYWEAIRSFRQLGIPRFDFVGARVNPKKGSKQEAINLFKERFGARLIQGYLWKYSLRPVRSLAYNLAVRFFRGGDIVDHERHKLNGEKELVEESQEGNSEAAEICKGL